MPEHAELYLLLQMVTPIPWLERVPTYKEQIEQLADKDLSSIGFLGYPLLQTADVIIYDAHFVPVGEDQVPHLELSREVVRRFNNFYGEVFVEPQPLLTPTPRLPGLDNRKMSKSYGNTIDLSDTPKTVVKKVRQMYTDPKRVRADIPGTVEGNPVFIYHDAFNPNRAEVEDLKARYRAGKVGDVEVKTKLAAAINALLDPIRERRAAALARPGYLREVLVEGLAQGARVVAAGDDGARARRREAELLTPTHDRPPASSDFESILEDYPVRLRTSRAARSAAAPDQEERGEHLRHPDRAHHAAVPRLPRPDAGAEPRRGRRVPGDGGDAHPHQVADAAAAARSDAGGSGRGSARGAGPPAARAPAVQGRGRAAARAARSSAARSGRGPTAASPTWSARRRSRRSRSICSA